MEQFSTVMVREKGEEVAPEQLINKVLGGCILSLLVQYLL